MTENARPTMRRKSSASNLLTSFKSPTLPPAPTPSSIITNPAIYSLQQQTSAGTPTTHRQMDWESQSSGTHSETGTLVGSGIGVPASLPNSEPIPASSKAVSNATIEQLREACQKRINAFTYLRDVHEGQTHWFKTINITSDDIARVFTNQTMKKRTYRFAVLAMSVSTILEITVPIDFLRALQATVTEWEQWKEEGDKSKIAQPKRLFRSKGPKRQTVSGITDYSSYDASEGSNLVTPHIPFPLDYHQTLLSLIDVLSECYNKMARILGPSPIPNREVMMGPLGIMTPRPGVSYLFSDQQGQPQDDSGLWGIANGSSASTIPGTPHMHMAGLSSPPPSWSPALGDFVAKIDHKLKKIANILLKDLDTFARADIQDELASLDPLSRNVPQTRVAYDFEGV